VRAEATNKRYCDSQTGGASNDLQGHGPVRNSETSGIKLCNEFKGQNLPQSLRYLVDSQPWHFKTLYVFEILHFMHTVMILMVQLDRPGDPWTTLDRLKIPLDGHFLDIRPWSCWTDIGPWTNSDHWVYLADVLPFYQLMNRKASMLRSKGVLWFKNNKP
jgi:hypothetical protein